MYRFLEHDEGEQLEPAASLTARGASLSGFSKSFGPPGLRIGWLASRGKRLIGAYSRLRDYTTLLCSAPSEILAIGALRAKDRILDSNRGIVLRNLEIVGEFFERHRNLFTWVRPHAGSVSLARSNRPVPVADSTKTCSAAGGLCSCSGRFSTSRGITSGFGIGKAGMKEGLGAFEDYILGELIGEFLPGDSK